MDIAEDMCLGTIVKYAMRYGKKDGKNKKDLLLLINSNRIFNSKFKISFQRIKKTY